MYNYVSPATGYYAPPPAPSPYGYAPPPAPFPNGYAPPPASYGYTPPPSSMPYGNAPPLHPTQAPCNREGRDMNRYPTIGAASAQEKESAAQAEACNTAPSAPPPPPGLMSSAASNTPSYAPPYAPPYSPPYTPPAHPPYTPAYVPPPTFAPTYIPPPAPAPAVGGPPLKKALLIGCSYAGTRSALRGCINDVKCLNEGHHADLLTRRHLLITRFGYSESLIVMLEDSQRHPDFLPTRGNIMRGIHWLLMDSKPGSFLFFSFSGHGSQVEDTNGDEENGLDETILPSDYATAGMITDDELNDRMVKMVMPGVTLNVIIDACHSGSVLDLQYHTVFKPGRPYVWKKGSHVRGKATAGGLALMFSACEDSEVAADTSLMSGTAHTGAATYAFIQAIERAGTHQSYGQVLEKMHHSLLELKMRSNPARASGSSGDVLSLLASFASNGGVSKSGQTPVLSCNQPLDIRAMMLMI